MSDKESYVAPELTEIGELAEHTQQTGWGVAELLASIISGGPISGGRIDGSSFS